MSSHIKRPINARFVARVRERGCRNYYVIGRKYRTKEAAAKAMLKVFLSNFQYGRGDVLMIEDWYEPNQLLEVTQ